MDTVLDLTKVFLSFVCFRLFPTDVACDNCFSFVHVGLLHWRIVLAKMVPVTAIMDAISL